MPGLIGERFFTLFDTDKDGFLKKAEFISGFLKLFPVSFEKSIKLIYDLFDFDSDGQVSKEDFRVLLSHVPLVKILDLIKSRSHGEGQYTQQGGGSYIIGYFNR